MSAQQQKAKIGVLGASGYTGAELVRLLIAHPHVAIALLTADRRAGQAMADVFPQFSPYRLPSLTALDAADWPALGLDLVFCALPHGTTQQVIKERGRARAGHEDRRSLGRFPSRRPGRLSRAGTAMRMQRRSCNRRPCTA